jgi:hypothetical protein
MGFMPIDLALGGRHFGVHRGNMFVYIILGRATAQTDSQGRNREGGACHIHHGFISVIPYSV